MERFTYKQELLRKGIHLSSLWMPAALLWLDQSAATVLLSVALAMTVLFEYLRRTPLPVGRLAAYAFARTMRPHETNEHSTLTGAFYMLVAAVLVALVFPPLIAATALAVLMIYDSAAALVGRRYGHHALGSKSVEGCAAFLLSAWIVVWCCVHFSPHPMAFLVSGMMAAVAAMFAELTSTSLHLDDNLSIPLAFAVVQALIFPALL